MNLIFKGPSDRKLLALTIDDFPSSGIDEGGSGTMALLDLLDELVIPATFFAIGERVCEHPGMVARAVAAGHELGNHMWRDQWSFSLPKAAFLQQLDDTSAAIKDDLAAAGLTATLRWFRPSGGWPHPPMLEWARSRGFQTVLGSIWPLDGLGMSPPEQAQRWFIEQSAHPGGIVILHDSKDANPATRRTLLQEVPDLQQKGFSFVTLSTLLGQGEGGLCLGCEEPSRGKVLETRFQKNGISPGERALPWDRMPEKARWLIALITTKYRTEVV